MMLRNHPLMSYHGIPNWPPVWVWIGGPESKRPRGEVGTLVEVRIQPEPLHTCFLIIRHEESEYMGCLLFDDQTFLNQMFDLLKRCRGRTIQTIGDLDITHTL
jgi:hypothetical protein